MSQYSYKQAGVDVDKANLLGSIFKMNLKGKDSGMFAGYYEHPLIPEYYLVACTDGVGTKAIPLVERGLYDIIATDLIAMNLNDLVCTGAFPMFFLDYIAISDMDVDLVSKFVNSLNLQLSEYGCTLLGGETSELKDLIKPNSFDVAGFAVGMVKKDNALVKKNVKEGDLIIGLQSSGAHSNGYTLIRQLHKDKKLSEREFEQTLAPTTIYTKEVLELCNKKQLKICANITGGGILSNLSRVIPDGLCALVNKSKIPQNELFNKLKSLTGEQEAFKTFNMGVGMCLIAANENIKDILNTCKAYDPIILGEIIKDENPIGARFGEWI